MKKVTIIDYGMSNLLSIARAIEHVGAEVILTDNPDVICKSDYVILPGVGAFRDGMAELIKRNLPSAIHAFVKTGKPFMGICLGMQMMLDRGEEIEETKGLGIIPGEVIALPTIKKNGLINTIPHMCWSEVNYKGEKKNTPFEEIDNRSYMYFVHSFYANPEKQEHCFATSSFGDMNFCSVVHKQNAWGMQFHPEKSGQTGLNMLKGFLKA